jgi:isoaspartyl peptidase/L-asparaginase-like protein (Ntn-hydrolase superfamily)
LPNTARIGAHPEASLGTVGAVALDASGNLAAATSTGGISGKLKGRVGDSPLIGAGTYADNRTCAVSTTGLGEIFIRTVTAFGVHARMLFGKMPLHEIGADSSAVALCVNADMYRGKVDQHGRFQTAIYRGEPWQES